MNVFAPPAGEVPLPQGCTHLRLRQLMRRLDQHYDLELARVGLRTTQYSLLSHIVKLGPMAPGALARAMKMQPSTLTRNLQPLVAALLNWSLGAPAPGSAFFVALALVALGLWLQTRPLPLPRPR